MDELRHHLKAIAARRHDAQLLRAAAVADRTEPVALDWIRRWGPSPMGVAALQCACPSGRCTVCN